MHLLTYIHDENQQYLPALNSWKILSKNDHKLYTFLWFILKYEVCYLCYAGSFIKQIILYFNLPFPWDICSVSHFLLWNSKTSVLQLFFWNNMPPLYHETHVCEWSSLIHMDYSCPAIFGYKVCIEYNELPG